MPLKYFVDASECVLTIDTYYVGDSLIIEYKVENMTSLPIYLFNRLARPGGESVFDIDFGAVNTILGDDKVVVGKMIIPVPEGREVEYPYFPCITVLEAKGVFEEKLVFDLPLSPFTWCQGRPFITEPLIRPLCFELGYAVYSQVTERFIRKVITEHGDCYFAQYFPYDNQVIIATDVLVDNVAVYSQEGRMLYVDIERNMRKSM